MSQPLVLLLYERLLPCGQLINRLQDSGYRVQSLSDPASLVEQAAREKPLLVIADLEPRREQAAEAISRLRGDSQTSHIPVIAVAPGENAALHEAGNNAGASLVVSDSAILVHLPHFIERALEID